MHSFIDCLHLIVIHVTNIIQFSIVHYNFKHNFIGYFYAIMTNRGAKVK